MMNRSDPLSGLVAASFTPLRIDGSLHLEVIPQIVDHQIKHGIAGMYVLGSTGEGVSFTHEERTAAAEAFVKAAAGRIPVIVQIGCDSLWQARQLAAHAQEIGADAISAVSPLYFKPESVKTLVDSMAEIASGAPDLPFYYYHIPVVTGVEVDMIDFLRLGQQQIATLRGIKFTSPKVHEFQACLEYAANRFEILWGVDEMLLCGLSAGARAAVGSTYNFAAPIYQQLLDAFAMGDMEEARQQQARSQALVRAFAPYGSRAAQKAIMAMVGPDCGPCRLPVNSLNAVNIAALCEELEAIDFFEGISEPFQAPSQIV
ncbi:dihydrodipicolinate synthase family protein [Pirellulales bacterium]|nr:dihydrodipicolinate synthase family protein [Pirellulales bacterium]